MKINIKKYLREIFIFIAILVIFFLSYFRVFYNNELIFYDLLFKIRPPLKINQDIVIIEISDDTLRNLGQWPIPRDFHASLIDILTEFKTKMIVFDIFFTEPTVYDHIFLESIKKAANVYIPVVLDIESMIKFNYSIPKAKAIIADNKLFKDVSNFGGHINIFVDPDGKLRRVPLFIKYNSELIPQLALTNVCKYLNLDINKVKFKKREVVIDNKLVLPISFGNSFLVNFPAKWVSSFLHLSYFEILKSYRDFKEAKVPKINLNILKDKVCIIGLTASGTSDIRANPLENNYPLIGLQASIFNSIVQSKFVREIQPILCFFISLLVFFFALFISLRFIPHKAFLGILGLSLIYFLAATITFIVKGIWIDIFLIIAIIFTVYISTTIYKFLDEIRKREILEKELQIARDIQKSFLPKDINEFNNVKISSFMQPAKFVAGDLYDIIALDKNRIGVFIGDVSGKGISAALIMAQTVSLFRIFARDTNNPAQTLTKLNKELCSLLQGRFVTALYVIIDTQSRLIKVSCAGHNPIIFYDSINNSVFEILFNSGPPLGILDSLEYESFQQTVSKDDKFLLYTDGILEARDKKGEEFGIQRIKDIFLKNKTSTVQQTIDSLKKESIKFQQGLSQYDDITLILLGF